MAGEGDLDRIRKLLNRMRHANRKAEQASRQWEEQKAYLNDRLANYDPLSKSRAMGQNLKLSDAMDAWSWWEREAKRCAMSITAEYHARALLGDL